MKVLVLLSTEIEDKGIGYFDRKSMEMVEQLQKVHSDIEVTCITVGNSEDEGVLREGYARKADNGVLIIDNNYDKSNVYSVAKALENYIKEMNFDVCICGYKSHGSGSGMCSILLSEGLGLPYVSEVNHIEIIEESNKIICTSLYEGYKEVIETKTPCVISLENNRPILQAVNLRDVMASFGKEIITVNAQDEESNAYEEVKIAEFKPSKVRKKIIVANDKIGKFVDTIKGCV